MRTWTPPELPDLPGSGSMPRLFNSATERVEPSTDNEGQVKLYVCGITPYDATHLGHAFTYLAFDLLQRVWRDAGAWTIYGQNITDVDDPLLERANETGVNWRDLADQQIALFRSDMHQLGLIPPDHFMAVTEHIDEIASMVKALQGRGFAYEVETEDAVGNDIYFDTNAAQRDSQWRLGDVAPYDHATMLELSAERGGDPDRPGKRDPLDPLLWRSARPDEPSWETIVGEGRPGWHVECSAMSVGALGSAFAVQGGGADLIFPHHEFTAAHATAVSDTPLAHAYCHAGLVAYQGHKMSKSRGNLVFVSRLLDDGADPSAIRLALFSHHYRSEWEWFDSDLEAAQIHLDAWREGARRVSDSPASAAGALHQVRDALADDLNTPAAIEAFDAAFARGVDDPELLIDAAHTLLGIIL